MSKLNDGSQDSLEQLIPFAKVSLTFNLNNNLSVKPVKCQM